MALTDGVIGCWSPTIRGQGTFLADLSGRNNHGTLQNMDATDWVSVTNRGVTSTVLDYDGVNDAVSTGLNLNNYSIVHVAAWVYATSSTAIGVIGNDGGSFGRVIRAASGAFQILTANGVISTGISIPTGRWFHLAVLWSTGQVLMHLDGVQAYSAAGETAIYNDATTTMIGATGPSGSPQRITGRIGEVVFWSRPLGRGEILELYRLGDAAIGRQLTGQTRRRVYGFVPSTGARRRRILCGDHS